MQAFKLQFIVLFSAEGALPSPGEMVAERSEVGCGTRETRLDAVEGKNLIKPHPFIGLIPLPCRKLAARIPHQSAARTSHADSLCSAEHPVGGCASLTPGEAIGAAAPQHPSICTIS